MIETAESLRPTDTIDAYLLHYDDTATWLAESLEGSMRSEFNFRFDGQELHGRDGRGLGKVFSDATKDAEDIAAQNPNLVFELRRRTIEADEYQDMIKMARDELPNTMVVVSDFPAELMDAKKDVGGYNVQRRTAYLRVITRSENGLLTVHSQSLDRSNREGLEAIYENFGVRPDEGELLEQRIYSEETIEDQTTLIDLLTDVYDGILIKNHGGEWHAGRQESKKSNTLQFMRSQHDLLDIFARAKLEDSQKAEQLRYDLAATAEARYNNRQLNGYSPSLSPAAIMQEMQSAGRQARIEGKQFSGCGLTAEHTERNMYETETELSDAGYGNKTSEKETYSFDKHMYCVVCQAPPEKGEAKKWCGPCGICEDCDSSL